MTPDATRSRALRELLKAWRVVAALPARFHDRVWHRIWHHEQTNRKMPASGVFTILAGLLLPLFASGCASTGGKQETRVHKEKQYIQLSNLRDTGQETLKDSNAIAMVCAKCKTVLYYPPVSPFSPRWHFEERERIRNSWAGESRAYQNPQYRHYCPGCKSIISLTGSWLTAKKTVSHTCESCGDDSVFCCVSTQEAAADRENGLKNPD